MKSTVMLPKSKYEGLVKKAQQFELFRAFFQEKYNPEIYSDKRAKEFEKTDQITPKLKKSIIALIKQSG